MTLKSWHEMKDEIIARIESLERERTQDELRISHLKDRISFLEQAIKRKEEKDRMILNDLIEKTREFQKGGKQ